jgi:hypothetical protein
MKRAQTLASEQSIVISILVLIVIVIAMDCRKSAASYEGHGGEVFVRGEGRGRGEWAYSQYSTVCGRQA